MQRFITFVAILVSVLLVLDLYTYKGLKVLTENMDKTNLRNVIRIIYWIFNVSVYGALIWAMFNFEGYRQPGMSHYFFMINTLVLMSLFPKLVFVLFHGTEDLIYGMASLYNKFFNTKSISSETAQKISRGTFLSYVGAGVAVLPFGALLYGMVKGRYDFRVVREALSFKNLPKAFDGLKVVQISDIHIGSFPKNHPSVQKAVEMINSLSPDIIIFTGDLVNNLAIETEGWVDVFKQLKAKTGKYAILGNHDYGDYIAWESQEAKVANLNAVKQAARDMGFDLLLNENRIIEKDGEQISLVGVENWGKPPFPQYGNLPKAFQGAEKTPFQMLLSHDPSHWDGEVLNTDIDITFSGHTHGSQFGIEIPGMKWSPVKYRYPRWGGLYKEGEQYLYVNRGFGYHAFAGRIGMPPEITEVTLRSEV